MRLLRFATAPAGDSAPRLRLKASKGGDCRRDWRSGAFWRPLRGAVPSLPAGINTDDSDPLGPDRGMEHSAAIGAGRNPPFGGGVAIVLL